jgi:uncharacterized protein (TIGR00661 family)
VDSPARDDRLHVAVSLSGEGSGHATRMAALCSALSRHYRLSIWCPHHTHDLLRRYLPHCTFFYLPVIRSIFRDNQIDYIRTFAANTWLFTRANRLVDSLGRKLRRMQVDVVMSDYEPLLPRAARIARLPALLFNHQGVVDRHPAPRFSWLVAWGTNRNMMPYFSRHITSSFYDGDVGPLLRPEITQRQPTSDPFIFVYAREGFRGNVLPALLHFKGVPFRIFPSEDFDFTASLAACRAVIAPAGHQLISEALYYRKPLLVFPQHMQYEQNLNARMLVRSGWGMWSHVRHILRSMDAFFNRFDRFPLHEPDPRVRFCFQDDTPRALELVRACLDSLTKRR